MGQCTAQNAATLGTASRRRWTIFRVLRAEADCRSARSHGASQGEQARDERVWPASCRWVILDEGPTSTTTAGGADKAGLLIAGFGGFRGVVPDLTVGRSAAGRRWRVDPGDRLGPDL